MIIKIRNQSHFAQIKNETLRDKRLSLETRGALAEILSYSEDFSASVESLQTLWGIGRGKLLKITNQLKESGYLEIVNVRDGGTGKIVDKDWVFYGVSQGVDFRKSDYQRCENHQDAENTNVGENRTSENTNVGENRTSENTNVGENRTSENPHDHIFKQESSQKEENKEEKEDGAERESKKTRAREDEQNHALSLPLTDLPKTIPKNFHITDEMRLWAVEKSVTIDLEFETEKFINHYLSATGEKALSQNWEMSWRNWILRGQKYAEEMRKEVKNGRSQPKLSATGRTLDRLDRIAAEYDRECEAVIAGMGALPP